MIYEGGWLEELAACGVLTPSSQRGQRVSAGLACPPGLRVRPARVCARLAAASLAGCLLRRGRCPPEQGLAVPVSSTASQIVAVSVAALTTGPEARESKP